MFLTGASKECLQYNIRKQEKPIINIFRMSKSLPNFLSYSIWESDRDRQIKECCLSHNLLEEVKNADGKHSN